MGMGMGMVGLLVVAGCCLLLLLVVGARARDWES